MMDTWKIGFEVRWMLFNILTDAAAERQERGIQDSGVGLPVSGRISNTQYQISRKRGAV